MALRPTRLQIGKSSIADVRHFYPPQAGDPNGQRRTMGDVIGMAVHHDGVLMPAGDRNYSGDTLDEDLQRLDAIHRHSVSQGWGSFPYHVAVSPHGRVFYTLDVKYFGAHVARRNHQLVGIVFLGLFTTGRPSREQLCAGGLGVVALKELLRLSVPRKGHREWALPTSPTSCPGNTWFKWQLDLQTMTVLQDRIAFPVR